MNTRSFNLAATSRKRRRAAQTSHHDRAPIEEDFGPVRWREETVSSRKHVLTTSGREYLRNDNSWSVGESWLPEDNAAFGLEEESVWFDDDEEGVCIDLQPPLPAPSGKKKRSIVSSRPHVVWKQKYRDAYLDELIRWDGRGDFYSDGLAKCPDCVSYRSETPGNADHRCMECCVPILTCRDCCLRRHRMEPYHRIELWSGNSFQPISLKTMGLRIQLNHRSNRCVNPQPCHSAFRVLHTNGIHEINLDFCGCEHEIPRYTQLLRRQLFPATQINPRTCATFNLLKQFHLLNLTSKVSVYDYYRALERLTDNTAANLPKSRYRALMRMSLQWRHLKLLKRAGRGHDPSGVFGTKPGELGILCPTCPHPGKNLPDDWKSRPANEQFLYTFIACMDANFRLKNQLVSNYSVDPGLGTGWAYMVDRKPYEKYVLSKANEEDVKSCVGLQALAQANTRSSAGLRYTGANMVSCGRGEIILPCGAGNLHKGERYANMDYVFGSAISALDLLFVIISYDVACQWFTNLHSRIDADWPDDIKPKQGVHIRPLIPKLHEPAHERVGHEQYSFNYGVGVGNTDGECPERIWSGHNALGNSTKTQGPGSRQDVLDDHFGFWNWEKYKLMGKTLVRRYKAAITLRNQQVEGHRGFTETVDPLLVKKWETICEKWEADAIPKKAQNPYHTDGLVLTEADVRKELAKEEETRLSNGGIALHETSAPAFVALGLELEDTQLRVRRLINDKTATARQETSITEQRNVLRTKLRYWQRVQPIYMPGLLGLQAELVASLPTMSKDSHQPEHVPLWLPSSLTPEMRRIACGVNIEAYEEKLRTAQCHDLLEKIRHLLRVKTRMVQFKNKNIRGQVAGTRSRTVINRVQDRARYLSQHYRIARAAKLALSGPGDWEKNLRELNDSDVRSYQDPDRLQKRKGRKGTLEDEQLEAATTVHNEEQEGGGIDLMAEKRSRRDGTGETRRTLSWIWLVERGDGTYEGAGSGQSDDILRSEWAKSRARCNRATEEVRLLREEMRRLVEFLNWKARWWTERQTLRSANDKALREGITSYAIKQARVQRELGALAQNLFKIPLEEIDTALGDGDDDDEDEGNEVGDMEDTADDDGEEGFEGSGNSDDEDEEEYY